MDLLRDLGGHAVPTHGLADVCDVRPDAGLLTDCLLQFPRSALELDGLPDYLRHDPVGNLWRPTASGKIPEAVQASGIEAFQPGVHPPVGPHEACGCIAYAHLAHADHVYSKHGVPHQVREDDFSCSANFSNGGHVFKHLTLRHLGLRKGKYFHYKRVLLQYLVDNDFIIKIGKDFEITSLARELSIPISSWYDITHSLENSNQIIIRRKSRPVSGRVVYMVYEIQLTKIGLELTRFYHA